MPEDDYLWDGSGEPDPDTVRLEDNLKRFAAPPLRPIGQPRRVGRWLAMAAGVCLAAGLGWWTTRAPRLSTWQLGSGKVLALGDEVSTGPGEHARLEAKSTGSVRLDPNSVLRVVRSGPGDERLALTQGTLHALIWAPAKSFAVDTPAGTSIDLGCAYTLTVDAQGGGLVSVSTGWVAFQAGRHEVFIPAGAACRTRRDAGPGLPYFADASARFTRGIREWELRQDLHDLLAEARPRDGLTLWHLLQRTQDAGLRRQVVTRLAQLIPQVDAAGLERGEPAAINAAWNALGLGTTDWWRSWKHPWAG